MVAVVANASMAFAAFSEGVSASHTISSANLGPASNLNATTSCGPPLSLSAKATLNWTATATAFASGYKVERWLGAVHQSTATVTPASTTSRVETGLATGTTYTWKVYAYYQSWTSTVVSDSATTPGLCL
jgi:hypothetical protein